MCRLHTKWKYSAAVGWDVYILRCVPELGRVARIATRKSAGDGAALSRSRTKTKFCRRRRKINVFRGSTISTCRCESAGPCAYVCVYVCMSVRLSRRVVAVLSVSHVSSSTFVRTRCLRHSVVHSSSAQFNCSHLRPCFSSRPLGPVFPQQINLPLI